MGLGVRGYRQELVNVYFVNSSEAVCSNLLFVLLHFFFPFWVVVRESSAVYCDECSLIKIIAEAITFPVLGTGRFTASNKFREVVMGLPCTALFLPTIHILAKHYNFLNKVRSKM